MSKNLSPYDILLNPVVTEKAATEKMEKNKFTFYVDCRVNKNEIKKAVEDAFGVTVISVNTQTIPGKPRRLGRFLGKTSKKKKAVVTLKEGNRIKLMEGP